jgi:ribosomal protein S18 acetylase RimI-like enzyme
MFKQLAVSLITRFSCRIEIATSLENVRPLAEYEQVRLATAEDKTALVRVAGEIHGSGQNFSAIFEERWRSGMSAYVLYSRGELASYLWLSKQQYYLYDPRVAIGMAAGGGYVFNASTLVRFRRQGFFGKLVSHVWEENRLRFAACCIRQDNQVSIMANERIGFRLANRIDLRRYGILRILSVEGVGDSNRKRLLSIAKCRVNTCLHCTLDTAGVERLHPQENMGHVKSAEQVKSVRSS